MYDQQCDLLTSLMFGFFAEAAFAMDVKMINHTFQQSY